MALYLLFLAVAGLTVLSPGPGVLLTLSNSIRHGFRGAFGGILGISAGTLLVASLSATGLGVLLAGSGAAFIALKYAGAAYLIHLGVRLWRSPPRPLRAPDATAGGGARRFVEGLSLQVTNPKAIFFFLSVFPQFIQPGRAATGQFALLVLSYSLLVILIHSGYALCARGASRWLGSEWGARAVNRAGGAAFVLFGAALATARR